MEHRPPERFTHRWANCKAEREAGRACGRWAKCRRELEPHPRLPARARPQWHSHVALCGTQHPHACVRVVGCLCVCLSVHELYISCPKCVCV